MALVKMYVYRELLERAPELCRSTEVYHQYYGPIY